MKQKPRILQNKNILFLFLAAQPLCVKSARSQNTFTPLNFALQPAQDQTQNPATDQALAQPANEVTEQGSLSLNPSATSQEELVSIDFRSTELGDVLRTLAEASALNIVVGPSVDETLKVTLKLNDVTYRIALKAILNMYGLETQTKDNIIKIERAEKVVSDLNLKEALQSTEWNNQPTRILVWQLNYAEAATASALISDLVTKRFAGLNKFSVSVDSRMNKIIIESIPDVLERAKTLLKTIDIKRRQVLIEARIVEASRELSRTLGVSWGARMGLDGQRGLSTGLIFPNFLIGNIGGAGNVGQPAPQPGTALGDTQVGTTSLSLGSINGLINIDAVIRAYETESMANIIAAPRIVVEDQDEANIAERTSISRETISGSTIVSTTAEFELSLNVRPKITNDGNVQMAITVNRGIPGAGGTGNQVDSITNRSARTNLSVADGETAVIGGLYQSSRVDGTGRIPILGDLPLIGFLFRTKGRSLVRTELMVMITPRIIKDKEPSISNFEDNENSNFENNENSNFENSENSNFENSENSNFENTENFDSNANSNTPNSPVPVTDFTSNNGSNLNNNFSSRANNNTNNSFNNSNNSENVNADSNQNSEFSNNEFSNNEFSNNEFSNNEFSNNEFSNNEFSNNEFSNNEFSNNEFSNNEFSNNEFSNEEPSNNEFSNNEFSNEEPSNEGN